MVMQIINLAVSNAAILQTILKFHPLQFVRKSSKKLIGNIVFMALAAKSPLLMPLL